MRDALTHNIRRKVFMSVYSVFYEYQIANVFLKGKKSCDVGENWPGLSNEIFIFAFASFTYLFCSQYKKETKVVTKYLCALKIFYTIWSS